MAKTITITLEAHVARKLVALLNAALEGETPSMPSVSPDKEFNAQYWARQYGAVYDWIAANAGKNNFATSLLEGLQRYGSLTERQVAAVERNLK